MSVRLAACGLILGAVDLAWAAFLVILVQHGAVSAWLGWLVPLPIATGLFIWIDVARRWPREHT